jgi:hypothetical protein
MKRKNLLGLILFIVALVILVYLAIPKEFIDDQIRLRDYQRNCDAVEKKDPAICGSIWQYDPYKVMCYVDTGSLDRLELCDELAEEFRRECNSNCDHFTSKWACSNNRLGACDNLTIESRGGCYSYVAKLTLNISLCESVPDQTYCYIGIAESKKDIGICGLVKDSENNSGKAICYKKVAVAKNDETVCGLIPPSWFRDSCYSDIAKLRRNESYPSMNLLGTLERCKYLKDGTDPHSIIPF